MFWIKKTNKEIEKIKEIVKMINLEVLGKFGKFAHAENPPPIISEPRKKKATL